MLHEGMYDESGPPTKDADTVPRSHGAWLSKSNEADEPRLSILK
jgi:hypothetical protein